MAKQFTVTVVMTDRDGDQVEVETVGPFPSFIEGEAWRKQFLGRVFDRVTNRDDRDPLCVVNAFVSLVSDPVYAQPRLLDTAFKHMTGKTWV